MRRPDLAGAAVGGLTFRGMAAERVLGAAHDQYRQRVQLLISRLRAGPK
ncbi:MAG: hypothetical protein M3319_02995 [Actinomycetota bacterium]|nr:hypothetical protein [Actinomycetota bacterium]